MKLILGFGFKELDLYRIYAMTFGRNIVSGRVLEKSGFQLEGIMRQACVRYKERQDFKNYGILRNEYLGIFIS